MKPFANSVGLRIMYSSRYILDVSAAVSVYGEEFQQLNGLPASIYFCVIEEGDQREYN
jgi:hypothetical protein